MAAKAHHVPLVERSLETLKDKKTQRSGATDSFRISTQKECGVSSGLGKRSRGFAEPPKTLRYVAYCTSQVLLVCVK